MNKYLVQEGVTCSQDSLTSKGFMEISQTISIASQRQLIISPAEWQVVCDFDGTIIPFDVTDAVLERFALPEWESVELAWVEGKISARECMEQQVALMRVKPDTLDAFLDTVPIDPGFVDFVAHCREWGVPLQIVSDGLDYSIKRILSAHGLHDILVSANRLVHQGADRYCLEFPYGFEGCGSGVCKCRIAEGSGKNILLIGDGRSDVCLAGCADFILAKCGKELLARCGEAGYAHMAYNDFFDIRQVVVIQAGLADGDEQDIFTACAVGCNSSK